MFLEITDSIDGKRPENFLDALKTDQNEKSYIFRDWDPENQYATI